VFLVACDRPPEAYQPEPNVYCLLRPNESRVRCLAGLSVDMNDTTTSSLKWNGVDGVSGRLHSRRSEAHLEPAPDSTGFYFTDSFAFRSGDTCYLDLTYPGGQKVQGRTLIPDSCPATVMNVDTVVGVNFPGDTYRYVSIRLRLPATRNAHGFGLRCDGSYQGDVDTFHFKGWSDFTEADTASVGAELMFPFNPVTGAPDTSYLREAQVYVSAIDENYRDFYYYFYGSRRKPEMHLDGALGVFGSAIVTKLTVPFGP
jgi:hypothetical protein